MWESRYKSHFLSLSLSCPFLTFCHFPPQFFSLNDMNPKVARKSLLLLEVFPFNESKERREIERHSGQGLRIASTISWLMRIGFLTIKNESEQNRNTANLIAWFGLKDTLSCYKYKLERLRYLLTKRYLKFSDAPAFANPAHRRVKDNP